MKFRLVTLFLISLTSYTWGQSDVAPKYVNEFLNIGVGALPGLFGGGVGGATFTGICDFAMFSPSLDLFSDVSTCI